MHSFSTAALQRCPPLLAVSAQAFLAMLKRQNQRWVPILDPEIHVRKGYAAYDSGIGNDVFVKDITGRPYVGQVRNFSLNMPLWQQHACIAVCLFSCDKRPVKAENLLCCGAAVAWDVALAGLYEPRHRQVVGRAD